MTKEINTCIDLGFGFLPLVSMLRPDIIGEDPKFLLLDKDTNPYNNLRQKGFESDLSGHPVSANALNLPLANESVHTLLMKDFFPWYENSWQLTHEIIRVLEDGSKLIVLETQAYPSWRSVMEIFLSNKEILPEEIYFNRNVLKIFQDLDITIPAKSFALVFSKRKK